jgi:hypothetical protein
MFPRGHTNTRIIDLTVQVSVSNYLCTNPHNLHFRELQPVRYFIQRCWRVLLYLRKHDFSTQAFPWRHKQNNLRPSGPVWKKTVWTQAVSATFKVCCLQFQYYELTAHAPYRMDTQLVKALKHCATSRKVAGSFPVVFIGIFYWLYPADSTMALGSIQPLTERNTRNIAWGKGGWYLWLSNFIPSCSKGQKILAVSTS